MERYKVTLLHLFRNTEQPLTILADEGETSENIILTAEIDGRTVTGEDFNYLPAYQMLRDRLLELGVHRVFLSLGADGIYCAMGDQRLHLPNLPGTMVNTTGCGDAAMAAIAWAYLQGTDLRGTALAGLAASAIAMEGSGTINPALGVQALKERAGL